ncbi:hypothetical protein [Thalassotalea ganghwensis]
MNKISIVRKNLLPIQPLNSITMKKASLAQAANIITLTCESDLVQQYRSICQQFHNESKWVLFINAHQDVLIQIAKDQKNQRINVLNINTQKATITLEHIIKALRQGHCQAIILCDPTLSNSDIKKLEESACSGRSKCVILNTFAAMH